MREIRFRGKRVDNGEWVYGLLSFASKTTSVIKRDADGIPVAVDSKTVGEWTGFQDTKNSCDIYEDDILRAWESDTSYWTGRVYRHESGEWQVRLFNATRWAEETLWIILRHWFRTVEVIGNTHDNPELLRERRQHDAE